MKILFLFLDGIGLGADDPLTNPFAGARMPHLQALLGGGKMVSWGARPGGEPDYQPQINTRATLLALDACLGVEGLPQSATGQATLLTGQNVPAALGYHYGPKPNPAVAEFLRNGNLFNTLHKGGLRAALLSAYPPRYFEAIQSGRRLFSAIPLAATSAGLALKTQEDLLAGRALAADFTAQGWREHLGLADIPVLAPFQAGERLARLAREHDFSLFEYWLSDYAGHAQQMEPAVELLEQFDQVMGGLAGAWDDEAGLILLTSDHGNLEDLSTRRHTSNPVPGLLLGSLKNRQRFVSSLEEAARSRMRNSGEDGRGASWRGANLSDLAPVILQLAGDF